jgi:hypothetical protein
MKTSLAKTITGLVILSLIITGVGLLLFKFVFKGYYFAFFPLIIVFFFAVNAGFFVFFYRTLNKTPNQFIRSFMASTGIKLVIYFLMIIAYMLASPSTALVFAVCVAITYLAFTVFDLIVMISLIRRNKEINNLPNHLSN